MKHVYVVTLMLPDGKNYFTGFERHPHISGLIMTGWNIYRQYALEFTTRKEARKFKSRISKDNASKRAKVEAVIPYNNLRIVH